MKHAMFAIIVILGLGLLLSWIWHLISSLRRARRRGQWDRLEWRRYLQKLRNPT